MRASPSTSSGLKTSSAVIMSMPGTLMGLQLIPGSDLATVTLYDNNAAAASGTVLAKMVLDPTIDAGSRELVIAESGVVCNRGIYMVISGTGAAAIVNYNLG
jgi:hypothetical protein